MTPEEMNQTDKNQEMFQKMRWLALNNRNGKERTDIRRLIASSLKDLLLSRNFMLINSTFLRVYGEHFLQVLSITFPAREEPAIKIDIAPLYGTRSYYWPLLSSLKSNEGWDGTTLEDFFGLQVDPIYNSFLAYQNNFTDAIQKEKELLTLYALPVLDQLETVSDILSFSEKTKKAGTWNKAKVESLLLVGQYQQAEQIMQDYLAYHQAEYHGFLARKDLSPSHLEYYLSRHKQEIEWAEGFLHEIREHNEAAILNRLNHSMLLFYQKIDVYSKTFSKKYPLQFFHPVNSPFSDNKYT